MRINAADVLGELGDSRAVGPLIAVLDNPEIGVRWRQYEHWTRLGTLVPYLLWNVWLGRIQAS